MIGDAAPGPGDGSGWAVPAAPINPWPSKAPGYTEGASFVGPDGTTWHLPVLGEWSYDEFASIRWYAGRRSNEAQSAASYGAELGDDDTTRNLVMMADLRVVLRDLILANYLVDDWVADAIVDPRADASHPGTHPIVVLVEAISPHLLFYRSVRFADEQGLDRRDYLAAVAFPNLDTRFYGWFDHSGCLFWN